MKGKVYFISGLGADWRVFTKLKIDFFTTQHIQWIQPVKNESLPDYCSRLITQIDESVPVSLIGVSFGGVIAQEIAKLIPVEKLIIISSIKSEKEMDWKLRLVGNMRLNRLFSFPVLKILNKLTADYYFGITSKEESRLLKNIIDDSDPIFTLWAIDRLMQWRNSSQPPTLHIHGTRDRIFPPGPIRKATMIKGGGHFMVLNRATEISQIINKTLN